MTARLALAIGLLCLLGGLGYAQTISGGGVSLGGTNVWTGQQTGRVTVLAIATATFTPDGTTNNYDITLVHASCPCTLANPSATPVAGTAGQITIHQSATGSDLISSYGSFYRWGSGTAASLTTTANGYDVFSYYVVDATHISLAAVTGFAP